MNWQEALNEIQSVEFDVNLNVVSSTDAFFEAVAREPAVLEAYDQMRNSGDLREEALGRLCDLNQSQGGMCICLGAAMGLGVWRECLGP